MNKDALKAASEYWEKKDERAVKMESGKLREEAEKYILAHNTCALATGFGDFVRCTPIEYTYKDGFFWMLSEGGLKFKALAENLNVCLAIYEPYGGFGSLSGMQVSGIAELVEPGSAEYDDFLSYKKIPVQALKVQMNMIKVRPVSIDFLCSEFGKEGLSVRQRIDF